jgi:hypothetical protein
MKTLVYQLDYIPCAPQSQKPRPGLKYLITNGLLSVTLNGQTRFLSSKHPLFRQICAFLPRASEFCLSEGADPLVTIEQQVYENCSRGVIREGKIDGFEYPNVVYNRVVDLVERNLPYKPLISLFNKLSVGLDSASVQYILANAGTREVPLSWDGNVFLYARANRLTPSQSLERITLADGIALSPTPRKIQLNTLASAAGSCADAGVLFELFVRAEDILAASSGTFAVSSYQRVSEVKEISRTNGGSYIDLDVDLVGDVCIRRPHDQGTAMSALNSLADCPEAVDSSVVRLEYQQSSC